LYRITELEFRLHPVSGRTTVQAAGYFPGVVDNQPTQPAAVLESLNATMIGTGATQPTGWVKVRGDALKGYFPWYKTVQGSLDISEEVQGNIFVVGTGTETYSIELRGWAEFKNPVATGSTPLSRQQRSVQLALKQRETLLKALASPIGGGLTPASAGPKP